MGGKMVELRDELHPYESMEAGAFAPEYLEMVFEQSDTLIGARIAREWARSNCQS